MHVETTKKYVFFFTNGHIFFRGLFLYNNCLLGRHPARAWSLLNRWEAVTVQIQQGREGALATSYPLDHDHQFREATENCTLLVLSQLCRTVWPEAETEKDRTSSRCCQLPSHEGGTWLAYQC